ncbi:hypothetical protein B0T20DRAFT_77161 [Sordaria brevicollis]|uniref:Uncharacterized protein n=1 Tax=Sordaria brevicollis TaxID=83679 RepID=A0AAE0U5N5_SORBR|nr:hypothetical protein B0T20DRAFT_77161 [Sordaria brevicollis]
MEPEKNSEDHMRPRLCENFAGRRRPSDKTRASELRGTRGLGDSGEEGRSPTFSMVEREGPSAGVRRPALHFFSPVSSCRVAGVERPDADTRHPLRPTSGSGLLWHLGKLWLVLFSRITIDCSWCSNRSHIGGFATQLFLDRLSTKTYEAEQEEEPKPTPASLSSRGIMTMMKKISKPQKFIQGTPITPVAKHEHATSSFFFLILSHKEEASHQNEFMNES